jgi:hypothetical protein
LEDAMSDLAPEDRALLDLARGGHEPTREDRMRVRGALLARIGVGAGLAATTATTSKAATMAVLWTKVLATIVIGTAVGSAGVVSYRATRPVHVQPVVLSEARPTIETAGRLPNVGSPTPAPIPVVRLRDLDRTPAGRAPEPTIATIRPPAAQESPSLASTRQASGNDAAPMRGMTPPTTPNLLPMSATAQSPSPAPLGVSNPTPAPQTPLAPTTLEAETRLILAGVGALHAGDGARALALFEEHARLFPTGALAEERAAERVAALGDLRRWDEARVAAAAFLRDHPSSPLAARVRAAFASTTNP